MALGVLSVDVWPVYLGVATAHPGNPFESTVALNEPYDDMDYNRGQISWRTVDGQILGNATVFAPKGIYTHLVFFRGPHREAFQGAEPLEHPLVFDRAGMIEVDPITNQERMPRNNATAR